MHSYLRPEGIGSFYIFLHGIYTERLLMGRKESNQTNKQTKHGIYSISFNLHFEVLNPVFYQNRCTFLYHMTSRDWE